MTDFTAETFEKLKGETFTLLAFGGTGDDGIEYDYAEIPITVEKVTAGKKVRYGSILKKDGTGKVVTDEKGNAVVGAIGDPVPDLPTPFTVDFHAPHRTPIESGAYTIKHATLGTLDHIHLSRFKPFKDAKIRAMDGGKAVVLDSHALDEECCILVAHFG